MGRVKSDEISKKAKYTEVIKMNDGLTSMEMAEKISTKYPEILIDACKLGMKRKKPIDGLTHIAACVSSYIVDNRLPGIKMEDGSHPRKIRVEADA